jgi:hypothetical protein
VNNKKKTQASSEVRNTYSELRKSRVLLLQHTKHKVRKGAQLSGEANRLLVVTRVSGQTLSSAERSAAAAAVVAIEGTALGACPEVEEEEEAERKEAGRGNRSFEAEGAEVEEKA